MEQQAPGSASRLERMEQRTDGAAATTGIIMMAAGTRADGTDGGDRHGAWRGKGAAAEGTAGTETDMFDIGRTYGTAANPAIIMEDAAAAETSEWE